MSARRCQSFLPRELDAVFLDRDGTLNVKAPEGSYIISPRGLRLLPGAGRAVRALNDAGLLVLVATNQRGVALGRMTLVDVELVNLELQRRLGRSGARVEAFYVCPHGRASCDCRKPAPGLLRRAISDYPHLTPKRCIVIGDAESDVQAGIATGAATIRLGPPGTPSLADALFPDLTTAVDSLLGSLRRQ